MGLSYLGVGRQHSIVVSAVVLTWGCGEQLCFSRAHLAMPVASFGFHYWREWCAPGI